MARWTHSVEVRRPRFGDLVGLAFVALIALKLAGVIAWSWWLVLLPLWPALAVAIVVGLVFVYHGVNKLAEWWHWRRLERRSDWLQPLDDRGGGHGAAGAHGDQRG